MCFAVFVESHSVGIDAIRHSSSTSAIRTRQSLADAIKVRQRSRGAALDLLMKRRQIEAGDLLLTWEPGQTSPLDAPTIEAGHEIGNIIVQRRGACGLEDAVYDVSFAFAFRASYSQGRLHVE
jgi:hypothetical protein